MTGSNLFSSKTSLPKLIFPGLLFLFIPVLLIVVYVLYQTDGIYIYPYDDTYIHLTIANNLVKGNWGINENEFSSASSSILYTLILSVVRIISNNVLVPFIVNCFAGVIILMALHLWLRRHFINYTGQVVIFLLVIFFTPLPLLIVSGMEHTLQCLFSFLFIFYFSDWLEANKDAGNPLTVKILLFAILASTIRYEGLFLIAIAFVLLLIHKKNLQAFVLGFVSILPLLIFGLVSVSKGNYFLPNSVLVKSESFNYSNPLQIIYGVLFDKLVYARNGMAALATQRLAMLLPMLYFLFKRYLRASYLFIFIFLFGASVLQLSFASTGYLYRYEAYLFFCFMIIMPVMFYNHGKQVLYVLDSFLSKLAALALAFFLFFPIVLRSMTAWDKTSQACINIYEQQYQMAMFTKKYYNKSTIALNDIGAVSYFTNSKLLDLWGLANIEVTKSKKHHYWTPGFLDSLCRSNEIEMAIIYDSWFSDSLTRGWFKAATWQIQNNVICGDSIVSFYSLDSSSKNILQQRLKAFQLQLPPSVLIKYY
jgi:hypothetical protein